MPVNGSAKVKERIYKELGQISSILINLKKKMMEKRKFLQSCILLEEGVLRIFCSIPSI